MERGLFCSVLFPDEYQLLGLDRLSCLFSMGLQDLLHSGLAFGRGVKNSLIWVICLVVIAFSWNAGTGDSIPLAINRPRCILDEWSNYQTDMQKMDGPVVIILGWGTSMSFLTPPGGLARLHILVRLNLEDSRGALVYKDRYSSPQNTHF